MKIINYDLEINWSLHKTCNFLCEYCFHTSKVRLEKKFVSFNKIESAINKLNRLDKIITFTLTGGEPFLHPQFIDMCKALSKKHYFSIITNLSTDNIIQFSKEINPENVISIYASLHYNFRKRKESISSFINSVKRLRDAGFNVVVDQVMTPPVIKQIEIILTDFEKEKIEIIPTAFKGLHRGRDYPPSYSEKEKEIILTMKNKLKSMDSEISNNSSKILKNKYKNEFNTDIANIDGWLSWHNKICYTGNVFINIRPNGDVHRCTAAKTKLGNIYNDPNFNLIDKPLPCAEKICSCFWQGLKYARDEPVIIK